MILTGGSSGLGLAIKNWAEESDYPGRRYQKYKVENVCRDTGFDISRPSQINDALNQISLKPKIDVLINNAGILHFNEDECNCDEETWLHIHATHLFMERLAPFIRLGGCIINIASISGITGEAEVPFYAATKAAVINLTKSYAKKLAPSVRVNCISPGLFNTKLVQGPAPQELVDKALLQREAEADEIIPAVKFLIDSKYTTGANIVVDGGASI